VRKKHWITWIVGISIVLGIYAVPAMTQQAAQQAAPQLPYLVAVIDLAQVIKQHPDFVAKQTALQDEIKKAEENFKAWEGRLAQQQEALKNSPQRPGTTEHQALVDKLTNEMADFEKEVKSLQRKFALKNSQIMYDTYKDIKGTIERYAASRNIAQVTDYREFEANPADPQTVAEDMDQRLVWYNKNLNITRYILNDIYAARNLNYSPPAVAAANGSNAAGVSNAVGAPRVATGPAPAAGTQPTAPR